MVIWHAGILHKLKSYVISGKIFGLISSFLRNRWPCEVLNRKSLQEDPVNAGVPQGSILYNIYKIIYNIAICTDDFTLYYKCDQASERW